MPRLSSYAYARGCEFSYGFLDIFERLKLGGENSVIIEGKKGCTFPIA